MRLIVSIAVAIFLASSAFGAEQSTPALQAKVDVMKIWTQASTAWERGDIDAMVALCADDVEYVNGRPGLWWRGKQQLAQGWKMERAYGTIPRPLEQTFRLITPDTAVLIVRVTASIPAAADHPAISDAQGIMSWLFVKRDGKWLMASGQTTMVSAAPPSKP